MIWNTDPVAFYLPTFLSGREIRFYGILFFLAVGGGYFLWKWQMQKAQRSKDQAERFMYLMFAGVMVGGRLGHCLFYHPSYYLKNPLKILDLSSGGIASHGATIGLIIALSYFAKREKMTIRETFDRAAIGTAWGAAWIRLGNFMNSEVVGRVTDSPVGVKFPIYEKHLWNSCIAVSESCIKTARGLVNIDLVPTRHPSQIYEFLMGLIIFTVLIIVDKKYPNKERPLGLLGGLFLTLYFCGRFSVEFFKEFQALTSSRSFFTMGQYLSIPFVALGFFMVYRALKNKKA